MADVAPTPRSHKVATQLLSSLELTHETVRWLERHNNLSNEAGTRHELIDLVLDGLGWPMRRMGHVFLDQPPTRRLTVPEASHTASQTSQPPTRRLTHLAPNKLSSAHFSAAYTAAHMNRRSVCNISDFSAAYAAAHDEDGELWAPVDFSAAYAAAHGSVSEYLCAIVFSAAYAAAHQHLVECLAGFRFSAAYAAAHVRLTGRVRQQHFSAAYAAAHGAKSNMETPVSFSAAYAAAHGINPTDYMWASTTFSPKCAHILRSEPMQ